MTGWNREVNLTTVNGVPVVWAETPGPMRATLMFRVGRADERLPWSGITHLVEHLALFSSGPHKDMSSTARSRAIALCSMRQALQPK